MSYKKIKISAMRLNYGRMVFMNMKRILGIATVLLMLVTVVVFAASPPKDGYYTSKDNGYTILIRLLSSDLGLYYIQYFTPDGNKLLTSEGKLSGYTMNFTDNAGNKCSMFISSSTQFKDYVTGGTFSWDRD
jgi:hypothetical protein